MRPFCASQITGGFFNLHTDRGTSAHSDSQQEQLTRAVTSLFALCLSVNKYLHVPGCTLQKGLNTRSEGFLLC